MKVHLVWMKLIEISWDFFEKLYKTLILKHFEIRWNKWCPNQVLKKLVKLASSQNVNIIYINISTLCGFPQGIFSFEGIEIDFSNVAMDASSPIGLLAKIWALVSNFLVLESDGTVSSTRATGKSHFYYLRGFMRGSFRDSYFQKFGNNLLFLSLFPNVWK